MKVCGQIFKQSGCCHTLKTPEQNLNSLRGFGFSKISPNLCSSGVGLCVLWSPWAHRAPAKPLSFQNGAAGAPNIPSCRCCGTPGLLFVGRELPVWEFLQLGFATGIKPCMENPVKEQPSSWLWQHQGWELHLADAGSSPVFSPCTQKLGERSHTCSFSQVRFPAVPVAFGSAPQAPPRATSPHNSSLGCAS